MKKISYKQIDLTNKINEIETLEKLKARNYFIIGVEIFDSDISKLCNINFDPQHTGGNYKKTALEVVFGLKDDFKPMTKNYSKILLITIKSDLDSIASMSVISMIFNDYLDVYGDFILRLKAIAFSDKHGMDKEWEPNTIYDEFIIPSYTKYGLPVSLVILLADINLNIYFKVKAMTDFLLKGEFECRKKYEKINSLKLNQTKKNIKLEIIIPNKLVFVESNHRGAIGYGYKKAPVVIAKNPKYSFGKKINRVLGVKYTIAQYKENYIDMDGLIQELKNIEDGWGGSKVIIGSPQTNPSNIKTDRIINLVKKYVFITTSPV